MDILQGNQHASPEDFYAGDTRTMAAPHHRAGVARRGLGAEHPAPTADKQAQQRTGQQTLLPVLFPGALVGVPPGARLVAQGAQRGIDHTGQERPADQAADQAAQHGQQR